MRTPSQQSGDGRRQAVLESALKSFARAGFRGTSMDAVAVAAKISRPGLYFLFESKEALFREAVSYVLTRDLDAIERILAEKHRPLDDRLLAAYDRWAGRYLGPLTRDVSTVIADNPELLDDVARTAPARFDALVTAAVAAESADAAPVVQTLTSASVGIVHQVTSREEYLERFGVALRLILR